MCRPGFQKYDLSGTDFFHLKLGSLEQNFAKICVSGATNFVKIGKKLTYNARFFSKNGSEVSGAGKELEKVGLWS